MERPPGVQGEVMGLILVGDSDFSLSHARIMLNISYFTIYLGIIPYLSESFLTQNHAERKHRAMSHVTVT